MSRVSRTRVSVNIVLQCIMNVDVVERQVFGTRIKVYGFDIPRDALEILASLAEKIYVVSLTQADIILQHLPHELKVAEFPVQVFVDRLPKNIIFIYKNNNIPADGATAVARMPDFTVVLRNALSKFNKCAVRTTVEAVIRTYTNEYIMPVICFPSNTYSASDLLVPSKIIRRYNLYIPPAFDKIKEEASRLDISSALVNIDKAFLYKVIPSVLLDFNKIVDKDKRFYILYRKMYCVQTIAHEIAHSIFFVYSRVQRIAKEVEENIAEFMESYIPLAVFPDIVEYIKATWPRFRVSIMNYYKPKLW